MKQVLLLLFLCSTTTLLKAQRIDQIQETMANYDYETALSLIEQKEQTVPLLLQKGKALQGLRLNKEVLTAYQERYDQYTCIYRSRRLLPETSAKQSGTKIL